MALFILILGQGGIPATIGEFQSKPAQIEEFNRKTIEDTSEAVLELIQQEFGDDWKIMKRIAECESGFRQYDSKGQTLIGQETKDIGLFQINPKWLKKAGYFQMDIYRTKDNVRMAKIIKDIQGLNAWEMSFNCWKNL